MQVRLAEMKQSLRVVMITGHGEVPLAVRAMRAGAVDFVEKPFSEEAILESIRLAANRSVTPAIPDEHAEAAASRLKRLSARERDVLKGLVAGLPNKTIACGLGISARTVESHRARVMDKMQASSLSELVRLAMATGLRLKS